jgi:hypothetical protein
MRRNDIIFAAAHLANCVRSQIPPDQTSDELPDVARRARLFGLLGECERFVNDLTNVPNAHNMALRLTAYSVVGARKMLSQLRKAAQV